MQRLPHSSKTQILQDYDVFIANAYEKLRHAVAEDLALVSHTNVRENLEELLSELSDLFYKTSKGISDTYFNHVKGQNQLTLQKFD